MKTSIALLLPFVGLVNGFAFSPENWIPFKNAEMQTQAKKKTAKKHFQSRSLVDYQKELEAGKVRHLFPVMFAKERIQKGQLRPSDVPVSDRISIVVCIVTCQDLTLAVIS